MKFIVSSLFIHLKPSLETGRLVLFEILFKLILFDYVKVFNMFVFLYLSQ